MLNQYKGHLSEGRPIQVFGISSSTAPRVKKKLIERDFGRGRGFVVNSCAPKA